MTRRGHVVQELHLQQTVPAPLLPTSTKRNILYALQVNFVDVRVPSEHCCASTGFAQTKMDESKGEEGMSGMYVGCRVRAKMIPQKRRSADLLMNLGELLSWC